MIDQQWYPIPDVLHRYEGSIWFETPDREFTVEEKFSAFLLSIVKGAPGLQELCLHGLPLHPTTVVSFVDDSSISPFSVAHL